MQAWFGIQISVDIINHITLIKSTDGVKAFDKIQHLRNSQQTRKRGELPQIDKEHLQNPQSGIMLVCVRPPPTFP